MKRSIQSASQSPPNNKKSKEGKSSKLALLAKSLGAMAPAPLTTDQDPDPGKDPPATNGTEDEPMQYSCETSNRFAILPIAPTLSPVLRPPKSPDAIPPKIFVASPKQVVLQLLTTQSNFMLENVEGGTNILPCSMQHYTHLLQFVREKGAKGFTRPPKDQRMKRFVLYGLNSDDHNQIVPELAKYGVKAEKVQQIIVKRPRYHDHCNYIVYVKPETNITLTTIQQVRYICSTHVSWANYIINGDGLSKCSNCQRFNHSGDYCNLDPVCGVCAESHRTAVCPLLLAKRAAGKEFIDRRLLKCAHCGQQHTAGYTKCTEREKFIKNRDRFQTKSQKKFTNAPLPSSNPWTNLTASSNTHNQPARAFIPAPQPPTMQFTNNSFRQPIEPSADQVNHNKFSGQEIASIFHNIIDIIDQCQSRSEQMKLMINVITQYIG